MLFIITLTLVDRFHSMNPAIILLAVTITCAFWLWWLLTCLRKDSRKLILTYTAIKEAQRETADAVVVNAKKLRADNEQQAELIRNLRSKLEQITGDYQLNISAVETVLRQNNIDTNVTDWILNTLTQLEAHETPAAALVAVSTSLIENVERLRAESAEDYDANKPAEPTLDELMRELNDYREGSSLHTPDGFVEGLDVLKNHMSQMHEVEDPFIILRFNGSGYVTSPSVVSTVRFTNLMGTLQAK